MLCAERTVKAARAFFQGAVSRPEVKWPTTINLAGNSATHQSLRALGRDDPRWLAVKVRANRYVNNIVEQDHRAIKRRCADMLGQKSFASAAITLAGVELAHRIRKQQFGLRLGAENRRPSLRQLWDCALECPNGSEAIPAGPIPPMHQISSDLLWRRSLRIRQKVTRRFLVNVPFGRSFYLVVMPSGARCWRYRYRYCGKQNTLSLGRYPFSFGPRRHNGPAELAGAAAPTCQV